MEILKELLEMAAKNSRKAIDVSELGEQTLLIEDLGYDSIDIVELIIKIESKYGIDFGDSNILLSNLDNINTISEYLEKKIQEKCNG